jgi:hypothetical protein
MATASSQLFGNWLSSGIQGFSGGLNKDWSSAFKTPLNPTQTLPVAPETTAAVAGGFMNSPEMQLLREEKDPLVRMMLAGRIGQQDDATKLPAIIKTLRDQQYEDRLRARPLEFQEMVAKKFLNNLTEIPQNIIAARRITQDMYAPAQAGQAQYFNHGTASPRRLF